MIALMPSSSSRGAARRRHVTFRSRRFENKTPGDHFINPRCFGEDLAGWLRQGLDGSFTPGDVIQEDYGWGFWTRVDEEPYWVYVGVMDESIGEAVAEWMVGVAYDPGLSLLKRLFGKPNPSRLLALCRGIDALLQRSRDSIENIEWWLEPHQGTPTPHPE